MSEAASRDCGTPAALLSWLVERCQRNLARDQQARVYLRENGIISDAVQRDYCIGSKRGITDQLDGAGQAMLRSLGISGSNDVPGEIILPTFDPSNLTQPVGAVRCWNPQRNHHAFLTKPAGLIIPQTIAEQHRVVITELPMLALRLAQAGVAGVVCAEDVTVLSLYKEWLAKRELVAVSCRTSGLEALKEALAVLGLTAEAVRVHADLPRTNTEALAVLGLDKSALNPPVEIPITPLLLKDICEFAQARLTEGTGLDVLKSVAADNVDFVKAYSLGYLPPNFRDALDQTARTALRDIRLAGAIIVPAFDERGQIVDVLAVQPEGNGGKMHVNLNKTPTGLLAPVLASTNEELAVVDSFRLAASLFKSGNVMLFRGLDDLKSNVERLWKAGVRNADVMFRRQTEEAVAALEAAGIVAEDCGIPRSFAPVETSEAPVASETPRALRLAPESQPAGTSPAEPQAKPFASEPQPKDAAPVVSLELVNHDARHQQAKFKSGDAIYIVEVPFDNNAKLTVEIHCGDKFHRDRIDLNSEAQRKRFSSSGALKTGVAFESISEHLLHLLDAVRGLQEQVVNPSGPKAAAVILTEVERQEAEAYLSRPDLLESFVRDLECLGWAGEDRLKRHLSLLLVSRLLARPVSAALRAPPSSGKTFAIETIAETMPPEEIVHVSSLSGSALHYQGDMRHKLLVIDEADALTPEVVIALRVLQSRGSLCHSSTARDAVSGQTVARFAESQGPVAVLTSTTSELDTEFLSRCFDLPVDISKEQTERILTAQRHATGNPTLFGDLARQNIIRLHRNVHRVLRSGVNKVAIPYFERIEFPVESVRHRREQEKFLGLLQASALLHQRQRTKQWIDGVEFVVASVRVFEIALALVNESTALSSETLSQNGRSLLADIRNAELATFTMENLRKLRPDWDRQRFRTGLGELLDLGYIVSPVGGRGRLREFRATPATLSDVSQQGRIKLRSEAELVKLVEVGFSAKTNFTPRTGTA